MPPIRLKNYDTGKGSLDHAGDIYRINTESYRINIAATKP